MTTAGENERDNNEHGSRERQHQRGHKHKRFEVADCSRGDIATERLE